LSFISDGGPAVLHFILKKLILYDSTHDGFAVQVMDILSGCNCKTCGNDKVANYAAMTRYRTGRNDKVVRHAVLTRLHDMQ
jgi:acyl-coenzyme A thioesterase PaaI-like protein